MTTIKIFLLLCQIQGGELGHCSPPHQGLITGPGWQPPGPTWQVDWPTWNACIDESVRKNAFARRSRYGSGDWAFLCYASDVGGY